MSNANFNRGPAYGLSAEVKNKVGRTEPGLTGLHRTGKGGGGVGCVGGGIGGGGIRTRGSKGGARRCPWCWRGSRPCLSFPVGNEVGGFGEARAAPFPPSPAPGKG